MTCKDCALYESCRHGRGFGNSAEKCHDFTARKFKIGDRVVRIEEHYITSKIVVEVGERGTVVGYSGYWCAPYTVKWDSGVESVSHGKNLELEPKKKPKTREICHFCIDDETVEDMRCNCRICWGTTEQVQCPVCKEWFTVGTEFFLDEHGICMQCFDEWTDKHIDELAERAVSEARNA